MDASLSIAPATDDDRDWLERLRREAYRDLVMATFGEWDEARHQRQSAACWELGGISIVALGGQRVGMVQVVESLDGVEVAEIQVRPGWQRQGIGSRVLRWVIAGAAGRPVVLRTGLENAGAIRLYRRLGFVESGRDATHVHMRIDP